MTTLEDFPSEILFQIVSCLSSRDLVTLSRVSRRLHAVSQDPLYNAPCLTTISAGRRRSLQIFLHTLLLSPGSKTLAGYVRSLTLNWNNFGVKYPVYHPLEGDIALVTTALSDLGIHHPSLPLQGAQLLLLLHLLPNLKILDLGPPCIHDTFGDMMKAYLELQPNKLPSGLQSLREFRCEWNGDIGVSPRTLRTIMMLPSIHTIDLPIVEGFSQPYPGAATSNVKRLRFSNANLTPAELMPMLAAPRALTQFSYYCSPTNSNFNFVAFGTAMQPLRSSLQYLRLDFGCVSLPFEDGDGEEEDNPAANTIGSLRNWPMLRTVRCSPRALLDTPQHEFPSLSDVLPLGICELEILDDRYWSATLVVLQVVDLLLRKGVVATTLGRLAIRKPRIPNIREILRSACEAASVELVQNTPYI